jgi:leader peptidase (prepilin peptidase)/N-methyltransferase
MILLLLFALGAAVGSFLNVCIWRLPRHESVVHPPSHCPKCNTRLQPIDLVPLLSQFFLRGRCRYCGAKFSWRYFGIEFLTGALFALVGTQPGNLSSYGFMAMWTGDPVLLVRDLILVSTLVVVFWVDYDTYLIQLESVFLMGFAGVAYEAWATYQQKAVFSDAVILGPFTFQIPTPLPQSVLAMVVIAGFLWSIREAFGRLMGKEAMGFGDILLAGAIGANLGWSFSLVTFFFLSVMLGTVIGIALKMPRAFRAYRWGKSRERRYGGRKLPMRLARHAFRKAIPFGPMLAIGAVATLLYGKQINTWYLNLVNPPTAVTTAAPSPVEPPPPVYYWPPRPAQ